MPNYCSNAATFVAENEKTKKLFGEILEWVEKKHAEELEHDDDRNFCDFFIPRPDWENIIEIPEGYELVSGAWRDEKVWFQNENAEPRNIKLTDEQKEKIIKETGGAIGDYDFCVHVWGTKWGLFDEEIWGDENEIGFQGTTAWGPFTDLIHNIKKRNEELPYEEKILFSGYYDYSEGGCDFAGRQHIEVYEDGYMEITEDEMTYEEGVYAWDGDHGTLEDPDDYWERKKEWSDCVYADDNFSSLEDGMLLFFGKDNERVAIMLPSQKEAVIDGEHYTIHVHRNEEDYFIAE